MVSVAGLIANLHNRKRSNSVDVSSECGEGRVVWWSVQLIVDVNVIEKWQRVDFVAEVFRRRVWCCSWLFRNQGVKDLCQSMKTTLISFIEKLFSLTHHFHDLSHNEPFALFSEYWRTEFVWITKINLSKSIIKITLSILALRTNSAPFWEFSFPHARRNMTATIIIMDAELIVTRLRRISYA
jgi:hypothetical protein